MKTDILALVKWFCSKLTFNELHSAFLLFLEIINGTRSDIKLKQEPEEYPNYRKFYVDPKPPLLVPAEKPQLKNWKHLLKSYEQEKGRKLKPVKLRNGSSAVPKNCRCQHCHAPAEYLYLNNGAKASQYRCKICLGTGPLKRKRQPAETPYCCPYCHRRLWRWKTKEEVTLYKCTNMNCSHYIARFKALSATERQLYDSGKYNHFALHYIFRDYHFTAADLVPARPDETLPVNLANIHLSNHELGLILTYAVSFAMSSRQVVLAMKTIHGISISHQTVLNHMESAAALCNRFNDKYIPAQPAGTVSIDETYIKENGLTRYTWFGIDSVNRAVTGWHLSDSRATKHAMITLVDCFGKPQNSCPSDSYKAVTDGNPSYNAAVLKYNQDAPEGCTPLQLYNVIGLQNLDSQSKEYRAFKQLVERLNRTYKFHTRPRAGFKSFSGAVTLTTLFVTFYNFMRPHSARLSKPPVPLDFLQKLNTWPAVWTKILQMAR